MRREGGVSMLELTIAIALTLAITASVFVALSAGWSASASQPEIADMQQRLRVAAVTITKDLAMAGAGSYLAGPAVPLVYAFPPVLPYRQGATGDDPPGTFRADVVSLIYVPSTSAQTTLRAELEPGAQTLQLVPQASCPAGTNLCSFASGLTLLVYDDTGNYDAFTAAAVFDGAAEIALSSRPPDSATTTYKAGSKVVEAQLHTYYLKTDPATQITQLVHYDGSANAGVPVLDHVVGLRFDYFGEPQPPALTRSGATYGPTPPPLGIRTTGYPAGENCTFAADAGAGIQFARLPALGAAGTLPLLTTEQLIDGPWCPDEDNANRWDADLLRVRTIAVTVRVESAVAALRGPAGLLFTNAGTSRGGAAWAPDLEIRLQVTPRNLSVSR